MGEALERQALSTYLFLCLGAWGRFAIFRFLFPGLNFQARGTVRCHNQAQTFEDEHKLSAG